MGNVIVNGGFELSLRWELQGDGTSALYSTLFKNSGARSLLLGSRTASDDTGRAVQTIHMVPGETYTPKLAAMWFAGNRDLQLWIDAGDGVEALHASLSKPHGGVRTWKTWNVASFVALGSVGTFKLRAEPHATVQTLWYSDDVILEGTTVVAIKLAERAVDAVITQLQSSLGTELGLIDTDRADGVTLTVPPNDAYYNHPRSEIAGTHDVVVEVFENSFDFTNPRTDPASQRAWYTIPITVRITCFGRNGESADTMTDRGRRYGTGAFNVFNKNYRLGGTDAAVKHILVNSYTPYWESEGEDENLVIKHQVTLQTEVECEETQT